MNIDPNNQRYGATSVEGLLSEQLIALPATIKFRRKYAIGPFVFDFVCAERKLVIEIEGERPGRSLAYDWERMQYLRRRGYEVLRVWAEDVRSNPEKVIATILRRVTVPAKRAESSADYRAIA